MRIPGKLLKRLGLGLTALAVVIVAARGWVVPRLIERRIEAITGGQVEIRDWWLNGRSAGVVGLTVRGGPGASAGVWASAERVTTDLTLGGLIRGRFTPGRIALEAPEVALRFDKKGRLLTWIGGTSAGSSGAIPVVIASGAKVTLRQEGRPEMVVTGVTARLGPDGKQISLAVRSDDRSWGPFQALGWSDRSFTSGRIELKTLAGLMASPEKASAIPFVPAEVWDSVAPSGEVDLRLIVTFDGPSVHQSTEIGLRGTTLRSETLDVTATETSGRLVVDDEVVTFDHVSGRAIGGHVAANGKADFSRSPRFDLVMDLDRIDIAATPKSWQLDEAGVTGRLSGKVRLLALLESGGVDLSGSSGEAVVEGGTIQGIPFKSLKLVMSARGNDLKYETLKGESGRVTVPSGAGDLLAGLVTKALVALQAPAVGSNTTTEKIHVKPKVELPGSITTQIELEDVALSRLIERAEFLLGYPFPIPVTGRLSMKAEATIPLGRLRSLKDYAFHGDLTLTRASAYRVDLGHVSARVDLAEGVLALSNLRGRLIDRPDGGPDNPPTSEGDDVPVTGPLPPGGFRGSLHVDIAPAGKLTARFEGEHLPLGELTAPALPRPTPLSGLATMTLAAESDLSAARDLAAWTATGTASSRQIHYQGAALDGIDLRFELKGGRLAVNELTALLGGRPLKARIDLDLKPPRAFEAVADVSGWELADALAWVPGAPKPAPVAGTLSARAEATGTLSPRSVRTEGRGSFERFQAGPIALGAVPFQWTTRGDSLEVSVTDARPFGGRVRAEANVPFSPGRPIEGTATVDEIDTAALSTAIPGAGVAMTGRASGRATFTLPPDVSVLDASVQLSAADLTVQGLPAEQVEATIRAQKGEVAYEVSARSLGGTVSLKGGLPPVAAPARPEADGELRAVGFSLDRLWMALGAPGVVSRVTGRGAIDANLRAVLGGPDAGLFAHGRAEFRDLKWSEAVSLGRLRGVMILTPTAWRVDPVNGDLLGGVASGALWGTTSAVEPANPGGGRQMGFDVRVDRLALRAATSFMPLPSLRVDGFGTLRLTGSLGESFRASGVLTVAGARLAGLSLSQLRVPAELNTTGEDGSGMLRLGRWSARLAGGQVHGDASFRLGGDRRFQAGLVLAGVDVESITRLLTEARQPASGKVSGRITLAGPDPSRPEQYRGKVILDLHDASLVALPVLRALDRFLGSARGGLFEEGHLAGTIAKGHLVIDAATLRGRLAQLHATGTVGFDGHVNLVVLVNTNQIIARTGQALVAVIPGLRDGRGRNRDAALQVANFLSNRLLKLRVTGTLRNPSVAVDPGIAIAGTAVGFFAGVLKLPLGLLR
jgi:translocation and assembly module TamB